MAPSPPAPLSPHLQPLLPEARLGEEGCGVNWGPERHPDPQVWERGRQPRPGAMCRMLRAEVLRGPHCVRPTVCVPEKY